MKTPTLIIGVLMASVAILPGCGGKCSGTYNCPAGIPVDSLSTATLPSALVEVSADAPCTATLFPGNGSATSVEVIDNAFNETLTCHVRGRLADGEAVAATINFRSATIGCCPGYIASGGGFSLIDAGADGP
jgi:ABC-type glycerol-3-phosphate transport system substrate-binding protein